MISCQIDPSISPPEELLMYSLPKLSQASHINASKKEVIYTYPLPYKFALPIGLSLVGLLFGVVSLAGFILLNWL